MIRDMMRDSYQVILFSYRLHSCITNVITRNDNTIAPLLDFISDPLSLRSISIDWSEMHTFNSYNSAPVYFYAMTPSCRQSLVICPEMYIYSADVSDMYSSQCKAMSLCPSSVSASAMSCWKSLRYYTLLLVVTNQTIRSFSILKDVFINCVSHLRNSAWP